jgi:hypothetical protein
MKFTEFLTEIEHLHDMNVDELLRRPVTITWKIDQCAFCVMNDRDELKFFGKDGVEEIDEVKQTGMTLYKDAIEHVKKSDWKKLPRGMKVFLENFNSSLKSVIKYKQTPKSGLIVSYVKVGSKVLGPTDEQTLAAAKLLRVDPPPVIFSGRLSQEQMNAVKKFVSTPVDRRVNGPEFKSFITRLFKIPDHLSWLTSGERAEGLVMYFGQEKVELAKLVDPKYTSDLKAKKENVSDFGRVLVEFMFSTGYDLIEKNISGSSYVKKIEHACEQILEKYEDRLDRSFAMFKVEMKEQKFTSVDHERVPALKKWFDKYWWAEEVFSYLLFSLRKEKARVDKETGFTEERLKRHNELVKAFTAKAA